MFRLTNLARFARKTAPTPRNATPADQAARNTLVKHTLQEGAGRVASVLSVRCMHSWRPFCSGWPGRIRSISNAEANHHTDIPKFVNEYVVQRAWFSHVVSPSWLMLMLMVDTTRAAGLFRVRSVDVWRSRR